MAGKLTVIGISSSQQLAHPVGLVIDDLQVAEITTGKIEIPISKSCLLSCIYGTRMGENTIRIDGNSHTTVKIEIRKPGKLFSPARIGLVLTEQVNIRETLLLECKNANIRDLDSQENLAQFKKIARIMTHDFGCTEDELFRTFDVLKDDLNELFQVFEDDLHEPYTLPGELIVLGSDYKTDLYLDGKYVGTVKKKEKLSVPVAKTSTLSCRLGMIEGNKELIIEAGTITYVKVDSIPHVLSCDEITMKVLKIVSLKEKLYLDCKEAGITSADSRANIAKIKLIAENMGITCEETDLLELFNQAKEDYDRKAKAEETRAAEQRKREQEAEAEKAVEESKRYVNYVGREKLVQMCFDEAAKYRTIEMKCIEDENYIRNAGNSLYQSSKQKEHDWATHGGIASGIAGGAAGLATAMNIQQKNADIRARNDSLGYAIAGMQVQASAKVRERKKEAIKNAEIWEERVKNAKQRLVENLPEDDLLARLSPSFVKMSPSEIGTIDIEVTISSTPGLVIYDTVPAVVDGHIKAVFWNIDTRVGEAVLSLPYQGAIRHTTLKSVFLPKDKLATNYSVSFEPIDLWAIETPDTVR